MTDEFQWLHVHDTTESDVIRTAEIVNWPALRECSRITGKKIAEVGVKRNLFSLFFVHLPLDSTHILLAHTKLNDGPGNPNIQINVLGKIFPYINYKYCLGGR